MNRRDTSMEAQAPKSGGLQHMTPTQATKPESIMKDSMKIVSQETKEEDGCATGVVGASSDSDSTLTLTSEIALNDIIQQTHKYHQLGWYLVPINAESKLPVLRGWNIKENCIGPGETYWADAGSIGIALAYSGLMTVDVDHWTGATAWFADRGIDMAALFSAPDAVQIQSGRSGHGKLLYKMPEGLVLQTKQIRQDGEGADGKRSMMLEFRCATSKGKTMQDVLPPSLHPETGNRYQWVGDPSKAPQIPSALLSVWQSLLTKPDGTERSQSVATGVDRREVEAALRVLDPTMPREDWLQVLMAVHSTGEPWAEEVARNWSTKNGAGTNEDFDGRWRSFSNGDVRLGTLFYMADETGTTWRSSKGASGFAPVVGVVPSRHTIIYEHGRDNHFLNLTEKAIQDFNAHNPTDNLYTFGVSKKRHCFITISKPQGMHSIDLADSEPPETVMVTHHDRTTMRLTIDKACSFGTVNEKGCWKSRDLPRNVLDTMLGTSNPIAPTINGIAAHPIVDSVGRILDKPGFDPDTGIYLHWAKNAFTQTDDGIDGVEKALAEIKDLVFGEFQFEDEWGADTAVALLLSAMQRKLISGAPGFLINASVQATGKTTLARLVHIITTGCDMPVAELSTEPAETKKVMLTFLMTQQPIICFDNVPDGATLNDSTLAAVLTSQTYRGRILGLNKEAEVLTNSTFILTGNNITMSKDLVSRLLDIRLTSPIARPEQKIFTYSDVVARGLSIRQRVITLANFIIRTGIEQGGVSVDDMETRFKEWDIFVRWPIINAGGLDPARGFDRSRDQSPDVQVEDAILYSLELLFGDGEFTSSDVIRAMGNTGFANDSVASRLRDVVESYWPDAVKKSRSLGRLLIKYDGHFSSFSNSRLAKSSTHGIANYRFIKCNQMECERTDKTTGIESQVSTDAASFDFR